MASICFIRTSAGADDSIRTHLQGLGHTVTEIVTSGTNLLDAADVNVHDLAITSETVTNSNVGDIVNVTIPQIVMDRLVFASFHLNGATSGTTSAADLYTRTVSHPITDHISAIGTTTLASIAVTWGTVFQPTGGTGTRLINGGSGLASDIIAAYDEGDFFYTGVSTAVRVVFFGLAAPGFASLNSDGLTTFNSAVAWTLEGVDTGLISRIMSTSNSSGSSSLSSRG